MRDGLVITNVVAPSGKVLPKTPTENPKLIRGDWAQWGGDSTRNNVPVVEPGDVVTDWNPGKFDRKTGAWLKDEAKNVRWVASLGSQTYGNPVVAHGRVFIGTNNESAYLKRYPKEVDLGCFLCFDEKTGAFLWQHSSEKLPTGRVHDWPYMGICSSSYAEGDRVWFVTSRGEVKCLDIEGFHDGEDDGPVTGELGRLFDVVRPEDPAQDKVPGQIAKLDAGSIPEELFPRFAKAGFELPKDAKVTVKTKGKAWTIEATVGGSPRKIEATLAGPRLSFMKVITPDDRDEADVIWSVDMMKQWGTSQHNMCSCSVTCWGDLLFVNTSNGVHEDHKTIPSPDAPSFVCMNKNTGEVYWTDNSPKDNILHGQWSSPTVAILGGVPQVVFGGGDGWVYSFAANTGKDGKPELLWYFDINPKTAKLELGGRGTRNDIIATPVAYKDKLYFATGQDPEHGEGEGIFWCVDPTKRGDISESLAVSRKDPKTPLPRRRVQAAIEADGEASVPNPNSGVIWKLREQDVNGDSKIDFEERFHRGIGTCAIKDDLVFVADFSGLLFCIDANNGKVYWTHDMMAASWGSPMIADNKVFQGDEDGDIVVFELSKEKQEPLAEVNMLSSVYSSPIIANGTTFIANKDHLFAIAPARKAGVAASSK